MKNSNHLEIELYPRHQKEAIILFQTSFSKEIRGSNFQDQSQFFIDNDDRIWLWKKLTLNKLIREYIVSTLASELGIRIPQSIISRRGYSLGLLQEWVERAEELAVSLGSTSTSIKETDILDLFVFEAWIGALDRHGGNYLTSNKGELWGIDFENCFSRDITGSELCLYYPWIKDSKQGLEQAIKKLTGLITEKRLLENYKSILNIVNILADPRAKKAFKYQLALIFTLLKDNLAELAETVDTYLDNSLSSPGFILYT
ncbi:MAG: hypothetical protein ACFFB2_18365 [Promethearchaeota archaeon]